MRVCAVVSDLMFSARIVDAADRAGADLQIVREPSALPAAEDADLLLVDWSERRPEWGALLRHWIDSARGDRPRLVLFGSHTDLPAHREAKASGIGPVMARSRFVAVLDAMMRGRRG